MENLYGVPTPTVVLTGPHLNNEQMSHCTVALTCVLGVRRIFFNLCCHSSADPWILGPVEEPFVLLLENRGQEGCQLQGALPLSQHMLFMGVLMQHG